ncbi:MAG: acetyl-CoA carboxylase biotin carboxyl carrier protein subunit [Pedobacter sp.]|nr:MAG: acetyl-CoA carboxylase biotin carboxyl carrier protein subunit [Pedobacter sp.]
MYQIKVNDKFNFEISSGKQPTVNGNAVDIDTVVLNKNSVNILYNNKSYNVEVVELNTLEKLAVVKVNGNVYSLSIKDQFDQLLQQLGMDNLAASKILQVKAPMPGLVLSVLIKEGDTVKKGDNLLVLEAMKMENMIKSPTDGIVKKVEIKQSDKVEKNQLLISFT